MIKPLDVTPDCRAQTGARPGRQRKQTRFLFADWLTRGRGSFEHDEGIRPAQPQRIHRREPRTIIFRPVSAPRVHEKGAGGQVYLWIWAFEVQAGRYFSMLECHSGFDQSGKTGGLFQMTNIGLHRSDCAKTVTLGSGPER